MPASLACGARLPAGSIVEESWVPGCRSIPLQDLYKTATEFGLGLLSVFHVPYITETVISCGNLSDMFRRYRIREYLFL
jgi:hypothetical protein